MITTPLDMLMERAGRLATQTKRGAAGNVELRRKCDLILTALEQRRWSWWSHMRELSRFIQPRLGRFLESPNQGGRGRAKNAAILDPTGTVSAARFGAGLMAGVASPARPWFNLEIPGLALAEGGNGRLWLDEVGKRMRRVFQGSNFYRSLATIFEEVGVFGTAAMMIYEDRQDCIRCFPFAAGEYYVEVDGRLEVCFLGRKIVKTVKELVDDFGLDNVPEGVRTQFNSGQLTQEYLVAHLVMPNDDRIIDAPGLAGMEWIETYWTFGAGNGDILSVRGYHDKPFVAPRWNVTGNDAYGRSPGMDVLPVIKQLQMMVKRMAQAVDKIVNPPMSADAALKTAPLSVIPGAVNFIPPGAASMGFKPLYEVRPDLSHFKELIADCRQQVKTGFFEDLFLMISQLDDVRTATEIAERKEEKMLMLGPALERLHDELLRPVIDRVYAIMLRNHLFPDPPAEIAGKVIGVEFVSTLAQAQKAVATTAIERLFAFAGNIAAVKPEIMDKLDADEAIDEYAQALGAPPKIVVSQDRVQQLRQARAQAQNQAASLQNGLAAAQAGKVLSETEVGGGQTALSRMTGLAA